MSNIALLHKEIKTLKNRIRQYERMYDKQVNPPVTIIHVNYKERYEEAQRELDMFKPLPLSRRRLYRKCKR